ncbi:MAG TPA: hypothetical protein VKE93_08845 [Candidatus Angelobacter sp.]|nr:hypothetical protein [Candidatus Angelobacter sp.]
MLAKCANPSCSTPFVYLRDGKIFLTQHIADSGSHTLQPAAPGTSRLEYFWLCGPCSEDFTLVYDSAQGVQLVGKKAKVKRSVA